MALTVGLPAAIATDLILKGLSFFIGKLEWFNCLQLGEISRKGVLRPVTKDIYTPILARLDSLGLKVIEETF